MNPILFREENDIAPALEAQARDLEHIIEYLQRRVRNTRFFKYARVGDIIFVEQKSDHMDKAKEALFIVRVLAGTYFEPELIAGDFYHTNPKGIKEITFINEIRIVEKEDLPLYIYMSNHTELYKNMLNELAGEL